MRRNSRIARHILDHNQSITDNSLKFVGIFIGGYDSSEISEYSNLKNSDQYTISFTPLYN